MVWFSLLAWAGGPSVSVDASNTVIGTVSVSLSPDDVRGRLADPGWVATVDGGKTTVTVAGHDGACLLVDYVSPSSLVTVRYRVRQCPTAGGYRSTLVESDDFSAYEAEWIVSAEGTGSTLQYRLRLAPKVPLPASVMAAIVRGGVEDMMGAFAARYGAPS